MNNAQNPEAGSHADFRGNTVNEALASIPESYSAQISTTSVKAEYEALKSNIADLQNNFIYKAGAVMLGLALLILACVIIQSLMAARIGAGLGHNLREAVFRKVVGFSNAEFDSFSTASLITRSTNDIQRIQTMTPMILRIAVFAPIMALGGIFKVFSKGAGMTWIIALGAGIIMAIVISVVIVAYPRFSKFQSLMDRLNLVLRESLTGMLVIRAFGNQKKEEDRFDDVNVRINKLSLFVGRIFSTVMPVMMFLMNGVMLAIVWFGAKKIDSGLVQVGTMMAFMQYGMQILFSFMMMSMIAMMLPQIAVSVKRVSEVLNAKPSVSDPESPKKPGSQRGVVEFKNVSFRYPNAEHNVIENVSFTALPGKTTALIGSTGSGKSTAINLIPRFYDATEGQILVDGVDVRDLSLKDLRGLIGYVAQKALLFSGTIESNIKVAGAGMTDGVMMKAAEIAQAKEFIESREGGYLSPISQGGANISGGQKQRVSIARAVAKQPEIFIFDDSFSALDYKTDQQLRKALNSELRDATVIMVAQRIGTIKHADRIIVFDEGRIAGTGTHSELMENCEVYSQIALSQMSKEELMNE